MIVIFLMRSVLLSLLLITLKPLSSLAAKPQELKSEGWQKRCLFQIKLLSPRFKLSGLGRPLSPDEWQLLQDNEQSLIMGSVRAEGFKFGPAFRIAMMDDENAFKVAPRMLQKLFEPRPHYDRPWNVWAQKSSGKPEYYRQLTDEELVQLIEKRFIRFVTDRRDDLPRSSKPHKRAVHDLREYQLGFIEDTLTMIGKMISDRSATIQELAAYANHALSIEFDMAWARANKNGAPLHLPSESIEKKLNEVRFRKNKLESQVDELERAREALLSRFHELKESSPRRGQKTSF